MMTIMIYSLKVINVKYQSQIEFLKWIQMQHMYTLSGFRFFFYLLLILISLKESPKTLLDFFLINIYSQEQ